MASLVPPGLSHVQIERFPRVTSGGATVKEVLRMPRATILSLPRGIPHSSEKATPCRANWNGRLLPQLPPRPTVGSLPNTKHPVSELMFWDWEGGESYMLVMNALRYGRDQDVESSRTAEVKAAHVVHQECPCLVSDGRLARRPKPYIPRRQGSSDGAAKKAIAAHNSAHCQR